MIPLQGVNFRDPFGLCPVCIIYGAYEVGSTAYDLYDLGKTAINYARGKASKMELGATVAGVGVGLVSVRGGFGKLGRMAAREGVGDANLWRKLAFDELMGDARQGVGATVIASPQARRCR